MAKEYKQRVDYLVEFCDKYGFERIAYGKWEKKINDNSSLLILLIEPDTIQTTYFIDVHLENEMKRYFVSRKESLKEFIFWQSKDYKAMYEQIFRNRIMEMINNMYYKILFNVDYGERI